MNDNNSVSFIPLGGSGDVTKNMYLYEFGNQILIVDCGLGFADETMLGVDLLLPDITYLLQTCLPLGKAKKRIVGMVLTHGHEDHIGALPFILPQLPPFPIYAPPFAALLANSKLKEFSVQNMVKTVPFEKSDVQLGSFKISFIEVTHSVPDTSHVFIRTPLGNFYHGSDFKFEENPVSGKRTNLEKIKEISREGVLCLFSDCLGAERKEKEVSERELFLSFEKEIVKCRGKFIVTTYSSNIARLNQIIEVSKKNNRKVCFIGRSLLKTTEIAQKIGYLNLDKDIEIKLDELSNFQNNRVTLIVAGSQGQENSAMARIANGEHKEVKLTPDDVVVFSSDPIPGNEVSVYELIDTILKRGSRVLYTQIADLHVSGHASSLELTQLIEYLRPKKLIPIGGMYRHMVAYRDLAENLGYARNNVFLLEDGEEIRFRKDRVERGRIIPVKNVYVDEVSGEELEGFVLRDRQKLSESGIVIILAEVDSNNGQLIGNPDVIVRGLVSYDIKKLSAKLNADIKRSLTGKKGRVTNWFYIRKLIGNISERRIYQEFRRNPLVLPIVIEV